jgi:hypothetical protein
MRMICLDFWTIHIQGANTFQVNYATLQYINTVANRVKFLGSISIEHFYILMRMKHQERILSDEINWYDMIYFCLIF